MDAIILAGGRGKRLGALTTYHSKATLHFAGKTLLEHTLASLSGCKEIERIFVATGYRAAMVTHAVEKELAPQSIDTPVSVLPAEKKLQGAFKSILWALKEACVVGDCLITGVDVVVARASVRAFIDGLKRRYTTFMVSPFFSVAPTHGHIRLKDNMKIAEYWKSSAHPILSTSEEQWFSDLGVRYFCTSFVRQCQSLELKGYCDFDDSIPGLLQRGADFRAYILRDRWLHFGVSRDFASSRSFLQ